MHYQFSTHVFKSQPCFTICYGLRSWINCFIISFVWLSRTSFATNKPTKIGKFDLTQTLKRLEKSTAKAVTIQDLQIEISSLKSEVRDLKRKQQHDNPSDGHESDHVSTDDDTLFNALINHCSIQKFYIDVTISVEDFVLKTIALFDTGADSNCILEGLIPTKYFHKTSEKLRTASGSRLEIQYKLPSAIIQNDNLQVETPFLLVKNLKNDVILGTPFIKSIFPIKISDEGHVCSDLPNAFWDRKKHMVSLPYEKDFTDRQIPTKDRPIQMSHELVIHCQKEINDLISKGLIRKSKSPWSCATFYVNKASEIERGAPRLVINYRPLIYIYIYIYIYKGDYNYTDIFYFFL
uniref:Polyprotein n=1 Tax=Cajanus cajan TaxID=3821 RepID=A0A151SYL3_CAJCA|nr:polyprotein [Cajanus cajan]